MKIVPRFYIPGQLIEESIEMLNLRMLIEQGNRLFVVLFLLESKMEAIVRFNNNIPYNGIVNAEDAPDVFDFIYLCVFGINFLFWELSIIFEDSMIL